MNDLIGKKIKQIYIKDKDYLAFETEQGEFIFYEAYGNCYSTSWIEHISGVESVINAEIIEANEVEVSPHTTESDNFSVISLYWYKIKTSKGYMDIDFRNGSNGYYGGSLNLIEDDIGNGYKILSEDF